MARALGGALRARFAQRLEDVLPGLVVHVADAIDRAEFDTVTAVPSGLDVPRSRVLAPAASRVY